MQSKNYTVGDSKFPDWLEEKIASGEVSTYYDSDGRGNDTLLQINVNSKGKIIPAMLGDTIMLVGNELKVISAAKAKKYKVQIDGGEKNGISGTELYFR